MDKYPPLSVLVQWREQGVDPGEIFRRCQGYAGYIRQSEIIQSKEPVILDECLRCTKPATKEGLCLKHYKRWIIWKRRMRM